MICVMYVCVLRDGVCFGEGVLTPSWEEMEKAQWIRSEENACVCVCVCTRTYGASKLSAKVQC